MKSKYMLALCIFLLPVCLFGQQTVDNNQQSQPNSKPLIFSTGTAFDDPTSISWEHVIGGAGVYERIEMTDEQIAQITEFRGKNSQELNVALLDAIGKGQEPKEKIHADKQRRQEIRQEFNNRLKEHIQSTLLPQQLEILNEIAFEKAMESNKAPEVLIGMLGSNKATSTNSEFRGAIEKVQKELDQEIHELRLNAWKKLLAELEPDERKVIKRRLNVGK